MNKKLIIIQETTIIIFIGFCHKKLTILRRAVKLERKYSIFFKLVIKKRPSQVILLKDRLIENDAK